MVRNPDAQARLFDRIIGHQRVTALLAAEVAGPAHAYLFVGPLGVGKATVARRFAAGLLCPEGAGHDAPCSSCRRVESGNHPDLILVEPDGRTSLTVEQARQTVALANLAPIEGARKVFLFEEAGAMTEQAANALLKTLEEPTPTTIFILVAEGEDELPDTIASRCRTVQFGRVAEDELVEALTEQGVDPEQAENAYRITGGRPGLSLALATRPDVANFRRAWLNVPMRVTARAGEGFRLAEEILEPMEPLLEAIRARQADEEAAATGTLSPSGMRALRERHAREDKRASQALLVTGLEVLASWYADSAAAQFGGPVRNRDVPVTTLALVPPSTAVANAELALDAIGALQANQRPQLVLANLFTELGARA